MKKNRINIEDLNKVNGGYIFTLWKGKNGNKDYIEGWEVINDKTGDVEARFYGKFEKLPDAEKYAREHGFSIDFIDWPDLNAIREDWALQKKIEQKY